MIISAPRNLQRRPREAAESNELQGSRAAGPQGWKGHSSTTVHKPTALYVIHVVRGRLQIQRVETRSVLRCEASLCCTKKAINVFSLEDSHISFFEKHSRRRSISHFNPGKVHVLCTQFKEERYRRGIRYSRRAHCFSLPISSTIHQRLRSAPRPIVHHYP